MADLRVELYGTRIGTLTGDVRTFDLMVEPDAVKAFGIDSPILSIAIPLALVPTRARKQRRRNFFHELLPEGRMRKRMAQEARVPSGDVIGLLRRYGRDVAGALQIWDPGVPGEPREPRLEPLDEAGVAELLEHVQDFPLGNKPRGGRSSLAGVQDKIVLTRTADGWNRALDGYPSTHILKPEPEGLPTVIYDEEYGARLARATGLTSFGTWIEEFAGVPSLVIERYDRSSSAPQGRIHQEDFNQVLGASGDEKYQRYGGKVSLARIARVLAEAAGQGALAALLRMVVVSAAVGNLDMHAKNVSLLHHPDGTLALAPAYDFVPQAHQKNDGELALTVAGEHRHSEVTRAHLIEEGRSWGLRNAARTTHEVLETALETVRDEVPHPRAHPGLTEDIARFARNLLEGRPAGPPAP
ncbi:MAG: HipA domain-containing protein [Trueperaceae bacterium]|nr:HipA domain-containing protein [Trueperaceae bacterium]